MNLNIGSVHFHGITEFRQALQSMVLLLVTNLIVGKEVKKALQEKK